MKKIFVVVLALFIAGVVWWMVNDSPKEGKNPSYRSEITLSGKLECAPPKGAKPIDECIYSIKSGSNYYLLKDIPDYNNGKVETGTEVKVTGMLSKPDTNIAYDVAGIVESAKIEFDIGDVEDKMASDDNEDNARMVTPNGLVFWKPNDFGLAVNEDQVLAESYIPPCTNGFDYCLYYNTNKYADTNFGSAGVAINTLDADDAEACTSVENYNRPIQNKHIQKVGGTDFWVFESGGAATGHAAHDKIYRSYQNNTCFQLTARISSSSYSNYKPGTIEKFTDEMRIDLQEELEGIVERMEFQDL